MKPYTSSKDSRKFKLGKFYVIVTTAVIVSAVVSLYAASVEMKQLINERNEILVEIEQEELRQESINNQKLYFESDAYIEKVAREKLGLVKPGDVIFIDRNAN